MENCPKLPNNPFSYSFCNFFVALNALVNVFGPTVNLQLLKLLASKKTSHLNSWNHGRVTNSGWPKENLKSERVEQYFPHFLFYEVRRRVLAGGNDILCPLKGSSNTSQQQNCGSERWKEWVSLWCQVRNLGRVSFHVFARCIFNALAKNLLELHALF